jgi:hypothetical protein
MQKGWALVIELKKRERGRPATIAIGARILNKNRIMIHQMV